MNSHNKMPAWKKISWCFIASSIGWNIPESLATPTPPTPESSLQNQTQEERIKVKGTRETATGPVRGYVPHLSNTGTKTDTPLIETPQAVSIVTRSLIRDIGAQSISQALGYTAGIMTAGYGYDARQDQITIRGFSSEVFGNYRDGLRFGSAGFGYFRNDPYEVERLEVFRGPTSVLYGANAPGGMVNVVSKLPTDTPSHEIGLTFGNWNRYQGQFDLNGKLDRHDHIEGRLVGLARNSDTQIIGTKDNRLLIDPSLLFHIGHRTDLTLYAEFQKNRQSMWPYYIPLQNGTVTHTRAGDPSFDALYQTQFFMGYKLEHRLSSHLTLRQNLRYARYFFDGQQISQTGYDPINPEIVYLDSGRYKKRVESISLDTQLQAHFHTGTISHTTLLGVDFFRQRYDSSYNSGNDDPSNRIVRDVNNPRYGQITVQNITPFVHPAQGLDQIGLYAQEQLNWKRWRLLLGGREDIVSSYSERWRLSHRNPPGTPFNSSHTEMNPRKFTGRAALLYLFGNGLAPYFSYSTSFLPTSGTTAPQRGGTAFKPTIGEQYELGLKYQPTGFNSYITATLFNITQNNVSTQDTLYPLFSIQAGQVRSRGAEFESLVSLADGLNATASYSYTDIIDKTDNTKTVEGNFMPGVPRHQASLWVMYTVPSGPLKSLGMGAGARYLSNTWADLNHTRENSGYTEFDLNVRKSSGPVEAQFNINNLTDRRVAVCQTPTCNYTLGRTVLGSLRYHW